MKDGLVFGGAMLIKLPDIAVAAGQAEIGNAAGAAHLDPMLVSDALSVIEGLVEMAW